MHLTNPWRGNICMLYVDINLLPSQQWLGALKC
jgi:hypothetical protein